jgi:mRNA interferase RelE/StbE
MGAYEILWKRSTEQDISNLQQKQVSRIIKAIESRAINPFPPRCVKLHGTEGIYRIRIGDYRAIYQVDTKVKTIIIYYIRHRKDAYRRLKHN